MAGGGTEPSFQLSVEQFPNLTGVERPFFDFWSTHILRPDDPHRDRWIEREEHGVESANQRTRLIESVTALPGRKVLDVGCQNGAWLIALAQAGAIPTGLDVDELGVESARIRAKAYGFDIRAETGDACEMRFGTGEFDVVASSCVLEHVPDKVAMLHECVRVIRPGGYLVLSAPLRFSVKHLVSDPHYQHKGVSVLPAGLARWWLTTVRGESEYEVETLPTKRWVERQLTRRGMELQSVAPEFSGTHVPGPHFVTSIVDELRQVFTVIARKPLK